MPFDASVILIFRLLSVKCFQLIKIKKLMKEKPTERGSVDYGDSAMKRRLMEKYYTKIIDVE